MISIVLLLAQGQRAFVSLAGVFVWILVLLFWVGVPVLIIIYLLGLSRRLRNVNKEWKLLRIEVGKLAEEVRLIREKLEELEDAESALQKSFRFSDEIVKPGDYLSVIVFGIAEVNVDPNVNIYSGDILTTGNGIARKVQTREIAGITIAENTGIIGKALEDSDGKNKIKVFVNCK